MSKEKYYSLMFYYFDNDEYKSLEFMKYNKIEDIDKFTRSFTSLKEMQDGLNNLYGTDYKIVYAKIVYNNYRDYPVLYRDDIFDYDKVIYEYGEYILEHENYFNRTPLRFVKLDREDYSTFEDYLKRCLFAYFNRRNYLSIRNTYFELKKLGLSDKVTIKNKDTNNKNKSNRDYDSMHYYSDGDDYLNELLSRDGSPDWEEIYNNYSIDDMKSLIKRYRRK